MSFIVKHYKPVTLGIVGALIYTTVVQYYSTGSLTHAKDLVQDGVKSLPIVLQQNHQHTSIRGSSSKKGISENIVVQEKHNYQNNSDNHLDVLDGSKKIGFSKRGWSYKGDGQWRCKVQIVGCFQAAAANISKSFTLLVDSSADMTDSRCILQCSKRKRVKFIYAGLRNGNECRCSEAPFYLIQPDESENKCNMPCSGDKSRRCGGRRGLTMLFRIKSKCVSVPSDEALANVAGQDALVGCYRKPRNLRAIMEQYTLAKNSQAARCILQCEAVGLVLAIPAQPDICYCGLTSRRFNLSDHVDMTKCSENSNDYVTVYRTNSEDKRCGEKRFLKKGELHWKVGLITFPGSGNTWIRHLLESATGIYTGSVYGDPSLVNGGYLGELLPPESHKVAVVKSHHQTQIPKMQYLDAIINVYRNPYDAILSEYNRRSKGHTGAVAKQSFNIKGLTDLAAGSFPRKWRMCTTVVLNDALPKMVFSYDELVNHTVSIAGKMARFVMGDTLSEDELQARLSCMVLESKGEFKRKKRHYGFDPYTKKAKRVINGEIRELDKELLKFGKPSIIRYVQSVDEH